MSLQETLIEEASARFPRVNAEPLVQELLARVRNGGDGFTGFVNELRAQGMSDAVAGWLNQDTRREPTLSQTERAFGREFVNRMASAANTSPEAAGRQLACLLPKAVAAIADEEERAFFSTLPSRGVAWGIVVALLAAISGLFWYVNPEPVARPSQARVEVVSAQRPAAAEIPKAKPAPTPAVVKPVPTEPVPAVAKTVDATGVKDTSAPTIVAASTNAQRGNTHALAALDALKPGASGRDVTAALNLSVIKFGSNSAMLPKDSVELLKRAAALLKAAPNGIRIEIAGYTDNIGDPAYNVYLSEKRAKAVRDELIKDGVKAAVLTAKGYGGADPVAANDTAEGRARNRRIEFTVLQ